MSDMCAVLEFLLPRDASIAVPSDIFFVCCRSPFCVHFLYILPRGRVRRCIVTWLNGL